MSIESALTTHLKTDATLSGLSVGVYPHVAPQNATYPFIVYSIANSDTEKYLNKGPADLTLTEVTINLDIHSESVSQREAITTRIKNTLHGFTGNLGTESLDIKESYLQSFSTFAESDLTGTDEQIYRASLSLTFFYNWS